MALLQTSQIHKLDSGQVGIDLQLLADETRAVLFQNELTLIETVNFELKRALRVL